MAQKIPDHFLTFRSTHPEIARAFEALGRLVHETGPLSERERRLVKLGIAIGVNTEGAVHSAVRHALDGGCTAEDLGHAARLAITTLGWPRTRAAMSWIEDVVPESGGKGARGGKATRKRAAR
jgi:alkylhydroperoxidase/carboxymuconolactone decarboxylase family protein YurZ